MSEKDYSKLSKSLIITDMYETDEEPMILCGVAISAERCEEPMILCGVAISAERCEEFVEAVEKLAVEQFGGATFRELLDNDLDDEAARASDEQYAREQIDAMMEAATQILEDASDQGK